MREEARAALLGAHSCSSWKCCCSRPRSRLSSLPWERRGGSPALRGGWRCAPGEVGKRKAEVTAETQCKPHWLSAEHEPAEGFAFGAHCGMLSPRTPPSPCAAVQPPLLPSSAPRLFQGDARPAAPGARQGVQGDTAQKHLLPLHVGRSLGCLWLGGNICFAAAVRGTLPAG